METWLYGGYRGVTAIIIDLVVVNIIVTCSAKYSSLKALLMYNRYYTFEIK